MRRDDVRRSEARFRGLLPASTCGAVIGLAVACAAVSAPAATLTWGTSGTGGGGNWDTTTSNWFNGTSDVAWSNTTPDSAVFAGTAGTVTLAEAITAADLTFTTAGYTITGNTLTLSGTPAIATGTGISATIASTLDGTSGFTKTGAGTLTLSAANSISGAAAVSAGRIVLGSNTALGTTAVTLDGGSIERNAVGSVGNAIAVGAGGGTIVAAQPVVDYTNFTGQLTGSGGLALDGLVQLSGSGGTYSGTITLADSETYLRFSTATAIASTASITTTNAGFIRLDGVTVEVASVTSNGRVFNVGEGTVGRLRVGAGTMSGQIIDGGGQIAIEKFGSGTLTLSGNNTYTGGTTISGGTVAVGNENAFGAKAGGDVTRVVVNSGGAVNFNGVTDATYGYTIAGSGSGSGALVNNGAELGTGAAQTTNIRLSADASIGGTGNWALLAPGFAATSLDLAGFALTKTGGNAVRLRNSTITAGTIAINQGRLTPLAGTTGNAAVAVTLANAADTFLRVETGGTFTIGSLAGGGATGGSVELVNSSLTVGGLNTTTTFSGQILGTSGTGQLTKVGTGTLTLSGNNTYTGGTTISGGTVVVGNQNAFGAKAGGAVTRVVVNSGGAVNFNGVTDATYGYTIAGSGSGSGALVNDGAELGIATAQTTNIRLSADAGIGGTQSWALLAPGFAATSLDLAGFTLTKTGGNAVRLRNSTITAGTIAINQGRLTPLAGTTGNSAVAVTLANAANTFLRVETGGTFTIGSLAGGGATGGSVELVNSSLTVGGLNTDTTFSGQILGISGTGQLTKVGTGTLTLAGASTYSGGTFINDGILKAGNALALGSVSAAASTVTIASGATLDINRVTGNTGDFFYGVTIAGSGTAGQGALINTGGNGGPGNVQTPTILLSSNASIGGSGNILMINFGYGATSLNLAGHTLTKTGNNTFFLSNTTVSAGTVDIQQGTLSHFQTAANASAAAITLADAAGATLALNNLGLQVGSLAGGGATGGNVTLGSATLTIGSRNENTSFGGSISGTGAVVKNGTGTQTFATANTYSGGTTINGGTLVAGNANAFGTSGAISVGASGTIGVGDAVTLTRPFSLASGGRVRTGNNSTVSLPSVAALAAWESQSGVGDQTLAEILNASGSTTPTALFSAWTANPDSSRYFSDILTLEGTGAGNTYVLSMDYAAAFDNLNIWYRTNIGDPFTPLGTSFQGNVPWSSGFTAVGQYGVDTSAGTVWVVTDHNSQFVIVPEPGTMTLTGLGLAAIGLAATRKRRA
jgi:fibronectin-binding autotransporter adhesin